MAALKIYLKTKKVDRSGTGRRERRTSLVSERLNPTCLNYDALESLSSAGLMKIETTSWGRTVSKSVVGVKSLLKDASNALMTSKELLKIINRIWGNVDQLSSSMSLLSALHAVLERATLLVNRVIQESRSDQSEMSCLMKCFAEEKASWKSKEQLAVETAIKSIAGELAVERKLRRRSNHLNKKLGQELAETKTLFLKTVKELEDEKRERKATEQVCDELARKIGEDKYKMNELMRVSANILEEVDKERELLHVADELREHIVQMKLSEAKHEFEKKKSDVDKLRKQLEYFLGRKKSNEKGRAPRISCAQDMTSQSNISSFGFHRDDGEVEDVTEDYASEESDLHSIELNMETSNMIRNLSPDSNVGHDSRRASVVHEMKGTGSFTGQESGRSESCLRSNSAAVQWDIQPGTARNSLDIISRERLLSKQDEQTHRRSYLACEIFASSTWLWEQPWDLKDPVGLEDEPNIIFGSHHDHKPTLEESGAKGLI